MIRKAHLYWFDRDSLAAADSLFPSDEQESNTHSESLQPRDDTIIAAEAPHTQHHRLYVRKLVCMSTSGYWCTDLSQRAARLILCLVQATVGRAEVDQLLQWLIEQKGLPPQRADCTGVSADGSWSLFTNTDVKEGEVRAA